MSKAADTLTVRMEKYLASAPNKMANEWTLLGAMYPQATFGDKANGGRMGCIRRIARNNSNFMIVGQGASDIAYVGQSEALHIEQD